MRESNSIAVEIENAPAVREIDVVDDGLSERLQNIHRRRPERRDCDERLSHAIGQRTQTLRDDGAQARGQRCVDGVGADGPLRQRMSQLERKEGVAAGRSVHADEHGSRQCEPETAPHEPMDRADRERLDR